MRKLSLTVKLMLSFLVVGLLPFGVISIISLVKSGDALEKQAYAQLVGMRSVKKAQLTRFFEERKGDMGVLVETVGTLRRQAFDKLEIIQSVKKAQVLDYFHTMRSQLRILKDDHYIKGALVEFERVFGFAGESTETREWKALADRYDSRLKNIMKENGWYDIFLIHRGGGIVYTVTRESDLGIVIPDSPLKDESLGIAFDRICNAGPQDVIFADFAPYSPSGGEPAGFMITQMRDDNTQELLGYIAFKISIDKINEIMLRRDGLGKTGESYLVGQDHLMRSDSYLDKDGHSVTASFRNNTRIYTEGVRHALAGNADQDVIQDYNNNPVLSAWDAIDLGNGIRWAMLSEINVAEAFCPRDDNGEYFFKKYTDIYGYHDLFLINPDGYCFYSAAGESDYQSNFESGQYADSGLGKLFRRVKKGQQYAFADFSPYAPSNNEPSAFIAQPVMHEGRLEIVVGLQLSLAAINAIMQEREGMGKTGESYLVGSDSLMRSDSFLDPVKHSVKASFANPSTGTVSTDATKEAFSGKEGAKLITDYNGNCVLSAFTPVQIGTTTWALITEINETEAFEAVNSITWLTLFFACGTIFVVILVAWFIAGSITRPINVITEGMRQGADQVASVSTQVSSSSQSLAEGASEQAASIEETASSVEEMSSMTKKNAENAHHADGLMKEAKQVVDEANESMGQLTHSMGDISRASEETFKIIKTIDEIAFQTNLLALNAAVEAARAGEAGAGFAVVADEVRNLAMRAADAAKNTTELIEGTVKKVNDGAELVAVTNSAFARVADTSAKVAVLISEISEASREQSKGIEQVNIAMAEMDKVVQQNASNSEESAAASEEMNAQAEQLRDYVGDLVMLITGRRDNPSVMGVHQPMKRVELPAKTKKTHKVNFFKGHGKEVSPDRIISLDDDEFTRF